MTTLKPIVKWAGGKSRLLAELLSRVPTHIETYAEPFAGGAALFFALASENASSARGTRQFKKAVLADQNEDLIACYRAVRDDVDSVIERLKGYRYDRELFYQVRELDASTMTDVERAARFVFLNRTCFNGLWRVNASGKFNVPFGRYTNPRIVDEESLRAASRGLAGVDIRKADFLEITCDLSPADFVYLDPPYVPLSKSAAFTQYAKGGFGPEDHIRLANEFRSLKERGVLAILSNADTEETRALYKEFAVYVVRAPRAINSNPQKRGDTSELMVLSWDAPGLYDASSNESSVSHPSSARQKRASVPRTVEER